MHTARHTGGPTILHARLAIFSAALLAASSVQAQPAAKPGPANACIQAHTDAQVLRKDGQLIEARERLLRCAQSDCPSVVIDDCAGWLPGLENSIPTAVFAISDPQGHDIVDAKVRDDQGRMLAERPTGRAVPLNPGLYTIEISAEGYATLRERFVMRESEKNRIVRVTMQPVAAETTVPPPAMPEGSGGLKPIPTASWILGGAALAGGIAFGISGVLYLAAKSDLEEKQCSASDAACERERRAIASRGKTYTTIDQIAGPVAAASLVAAVIVYAVSDPAPDTDSSARLRLQPLASVHGAQLELSGQF